MNAFAFAVALGVAVRPGDSTDTADSAEKRPGIARPFTHLWIYAEVTATRRNLQEHAFPGAPEKTVAFAGTPSFPL